MTPIEEMRKSLKDLKKQLQTLGKKVNGIYSNTLREMITKARYIGTKHKNLDDLSDEIMKVSQEEDYDSQIGTCQNILFNVEHINKTVGDFIDSFSEDRAVKYVYLGETIETLYYVYGYSHVPIEDIALLFGLVVNANYEYILKSEDNEPYDANVIVVLKNYFNPDGTFRYNENLELFKKSISIFEKKDSSLRNALYNMLDIDYEIESFSELFTELLKKSNERILAKQKTSATLRLKSAIWSYYEQGKKRYPELVNDYVWEVLAASFDEKKAVKPLEIAGFLHSINLCITEVPMNAKDIAECLGMLVYIDSKEGPKNRLYKESHEKEVKALLAYFNEDGSFKENARVTDFIKIIYELTAKDFRREGKMDLIGHLDLIPEELGKLLEESNEQYRQLHAEERRVAKEMAARESLSRYYEDGHVLEVPLHLDEFLSLLHNCGYTIEEENAIIRHMNNRKRLFNNRVSSILDEEEIQCYLDANECLIMLSVTSDDYKKMREEFKNLSTVADMLSYELDREEREYLESEKTRILEYLQKMTAKYTVSEDGEVSSISNVSNAEKTLQMKPIAK